MGGTRARHRLFRRATVYALSSRAIERCPTWVTATKSRASRPLACSAQRSAECGVMLPFSPGAASSWTGAACSLVGLQSPAVCATRVGDDSDSNFENYDLFHARSPDTGRGLHARSWRANRDVDARCY